MNILLRKYFRMIFIIVKSMPKEFQSDFVSYVDNDQNNIDSGVFLV